MSDNLAKRIDRLESIEAIVECCAHDFQALRT